jgi:hypothetical protein
MPFNGSGTAEGVGRPQYPPQSNEIIYAAYFITIINDILSMLTNCVTRDGQSPLSQNLPANSKKITGLAAGTADGDALAFNQADVRIQSFANAVAFALSPTVPTGIDRTGGAAAASQQYVEVAAARAATEVIPAVSAGAEGLAIFNFMGG